ncbi:hypothetical protein [Novacetimonas pomaceti]|uniref:hypothetical protein n=1 Tax=Novacetimonas pomaceti TaxID=2021998 RepID=UPI00140207AC|nr:hypothetical protein [Novacetimonas pomaceti]
MAANVVGKGGGFIPDGAARRGGAGDGRWKIAWADRGLAGRFLRLCMIPRKIR